MKKCSSKLWPLVLAGLLSLCTVSCGDNTQDVVAPGTVHTPVISPGSGTYEGSVAVSITCNTVDTDIY